jgi:hypothetical protein
MIKGLFPAELPAAIVVRILKFAAERVDTRKGSYHLLLLSVSKRGKNFQKEQGDEKFWLTCHYCFAKPTEWITFREGLRHRCHKHKWK